VHEEMVPETGSRFPVLSKPLATRTENWFSAMLSANVGSFSLDGQVSAAGYARSGLRADGDGLFRPAASHTVHTPAAVRIDVPIDGRACGTARNAMPSIDGTVEGASIRIL
jgi:hypothetical protein